jgi:hypothetical protein
MLTRVTFHYRDGGWSTKYNGTCLMTGLVPQLGSREESGRVAAWQTGPVTDRCPTTDPSQAGMRESHE